ncbi:hypothetical protein [Protaetiibacter intestinalis]|uniref:Uncharacterized protein n=1 Tax=Protaetiibacter intestinalis TaxID=2419774 RepID=A0A387BCV3_9MICO|nr:hypothetical protein [Protaetiibacter intestinalis]AYF98709.1 hypothetical protein D7I47_10915 [Protaetiibacter intestinalis]
MKTTTTFGAAAGALALLLALSGCAGPVAPDDASSSETPTAAASDEPTVEETDDGAAEEEPADEPVAEAPALDATERAAVIAALNAGRIDDIRPYLADPVNYILAASECCGLIAASEVAGASGYLSASSWSSPVPDAQLDAFRAGWYGDLIPADVVSAQAADGTIVIFGVADGLITSILIGDAVVFTS